MAVPPEQTGRNSSSREHPQLYAEQVRLLYRNAPVGLIATFVNSAVLVVILRSVVPHRILTAWFVSILLVSLSRYVQFVWFRRVPRESSDVGSWGVWFVAGLALSGVIWGSAGIFLFSGVSLIHQAFLAFVLGGMAIGAAGAFAVVMPAFMAYTLTSLTPLIVRFLTAGDEIHLAMGGMSLLFVALITGIAFHINRVTLGSLLLRFENNNLVVYLSSAKNDLEKLNRELSTEIVERRRAEEELKQHREHLEELVDDRTGELISANARLQQEMSERKRFQDLLSQGKKEWEETFDAINDAITIHDGNFNVMRANKAAEKILGLPFSRILGQKCYRLYHGSDSPSEGCASCMVLKTGRPSTFEKFEPHLNKYIEIKAFPLFDENNQIIKVVHVIRDTTRHKQMEADIMKAQKLESVGILAGGIAHDFNNLLQVIMGNISLAKMFSDPKDRIFRLLADSERAAEDATELSYRLLTFSKGGEPVRSIISLRGLLVEAASLSLSGSNVVCELCLPEDLDPVEVDEGQMKQVFNNLLINAKEAMPEGGTIGISAANVRITEGDSIPLKYGQYVKISVADRGPGIPETNLLKIFDPYFSTKDRGGQKGMGLGLAICHSIITRHEGHMAVESTVGVGTAFHIYLPASAKAGLEEKTGKKGDLFAGAGRVLFMDDEERVRRIAGAMLRQLGYEFELAGNGEEAIEAYRKAKGAGKTFAAVILDLTVQGGMGGEKTLKKLREIDPAVRAVISSGYADDPILKDFRAHGFADAIAKPYTIAKLTELLRRHKG